MKYLLLLSTALFFACCGNEVKEKTDSPLSEISDKQDTTVNIVSKFVDPTKSMSNEELRNFDSLFNVKYSEFFNEWKSKYEDSLNCEIIFHTARDGYALCINFINFSDSTFLDANLDGIISNISDDEFKKIEAPMRFIHTRRIMEWPTESLYELRFSGALYQHYEFMEE